MAILALKKLDKLFHPESVAIIGASPDKKKVGYAALRNMVDCGFKGRLYAINPKAAEYGEIEGVKVYANVSEISDTIDLAVVCIPAQFIPSLMEELGQKGVKYAAIITAGLSIPGKPISSEERITSLMEGPLSTVISYSVFCVTFNPAASPARHKISPAVMIR